jgi:hypothetical protein
MNLDSSYCLRWNQTEYYYEFMIHNNVKSNGCIIFVLFSYENMYFDYYFY